jgi:hypothetical protein
MRPSAPIVERGCLFKESPEGLKSVAKVAVIRMILMPFTAIIAIRKYWDLLAVFLVIGGRGLRMDGQGKEVKER